MATTFDEILLKTDYLAGTRGAAQWASVVIRPEAGGGIADRHTNRRQSISRYEIEYDGLTRTQMRDLRRFAVLRCGQARAFRFLAPDNHRIAMESVGIFDDDTGRGKLIPLVAANGSFTEFFVIKTYTDAGRTEIKRLAKPSPLADFMVTLIAGGNTSVGVFPASNTIIPGKNITVPGYGGITLDYRKGKLIFSVPPPPGAQILVTGEYHLPVTFADDWQKFSVDADDNCSYRPNVQEVLPAEIGLNETGNTTGGGVPAVVITAPAANAQIIGNFIFSAEPSGGAASVRFYLGGALLAEKSAAPYQITVNSRLFSNGSHDLQAAVPGAGGTFQYSQIVPVILANDLIAPTVQITAPGNYETVSGTVTVRAAAADETLLDRVDFFDEIDGVQTLIETDTTAPFSFALDTLKYPDGNLKLVAVAVDAQTNRSAGSEVTISINNTGEIPNKALVDTATEKALVDTATGKKEVNSE